MNWFNILLFYFLQGKKRSCISLNGWKHSVTPVEGFLRAAAEVGGSSPISNGLFFFLVPSSPPWPLGGFPVKTAPAFAAKRKRPVYFSSTQRSSQSQWEKKKFKLGCGKKQIRTRTLHDDRRSDLRCEPWKCWQATFYFHALAPWTNYKNWISECQYGCSFTVDTQSTAAKMPWAQKAFCFERAINTLTADKRTCLFF